MNIGLLRKIAAKGLQFPNTIDMVVWGKRELQDEDHPCGAVGCIAGTAVLMEAPERFKELALLISRYPFFAGSQFAADACRALELNVTDGNRLFHVCEWPESFKDDYLSTLTAPDRSEVISNRIEHFIATEGRE